MTMVSPLGLLTVISVYEYGSCLGPSHPIFTETCDMFSLHFGLSSSVLQEPPATDPLGRGFRLSRNRGSQSITAPRRRISQARPIRVSHRSDELSVSRCCNLYRSQTGETICTHV